MAYPLIILGAGASIGSRNENNNSDAPPITDNIFNHSYSASIYNQFYKEIAYLVSESDYKVNPNNSFEQFLTFILENESKTNKERFKQLIALRFYLQHLFKLISSNYFSEKNNYKYILSRIHQSGNRAIFVNFNYDLLLERNLPEIFNTVNINQYISGAIKIIKIHGCCDWVDLTHEEEGSQNFPNAYDVFMRTAENIHHGANNMSLQIKKKSNQWDFTEHLSGSTKYYLPAIALPFLNKNEYVCPKFHIDELRNTLINDIDRILIIGWKANDSFLLKVLNDNLIGKKIPMTIVSGSNPYAILNKIKHISSLKINIFEQNGFSNFISSGECDKFFQD